MGKVSGVREGMRMTDENGSEKEDQLAVDSFTRLLSSLAGRCCR